MQWIKKHYDMIIVGLSIILSIWIRFLCRDVLSGDYETFLSGWVNFFRENNGWQGLRHAVGDYNVVYQYILVVISYLPFSDLYLIKLVSCIFDVLLAVGCAKVISASGASKVMQRIAFSVVLLLPTVWMNSAYWGQCDSIYVAFIIWSVYCLLKKKNYASMALLALAFTFKLQTIFIFPLYFIELVRRNVKLRHVAVFPLTYLVTCIPALIYGKPFADIIGIYVNQTTEYNLMTMNSPSVMQFFDVIAYQPTIEKLGIIAAAVYALTICFIALKRKNHEPKHMIALGLLFSLGIPFFLPHMHDRYFYMAGIFAVLYTCLYGKKRIWVMLLVEAVSLIFYLHFFALINLYGGVLGTHILTRMNASTCLLAVLTVVTILYLHDFSTKERKFPIRTVAISLCCIIALSAIVQTVTSKDKLLIKIDGRLVNYTDVTPHERDGKLMVPLRAVFNTGGYTLRFDRESSYSLLTKGDKVISMRSGATEVILNGTTIPLATQCYIENSYTFMDLADAVMLMDMSISRKGNTVYLTSNQ